MGQLVAANNSCYNLTETKKQLEAETLFSEDKYWPT